MDNFFAEGTRVWLRDKDQLYPCTVSSCIDGSLVLTADYGTVHCLELSSVSREKVFPMHQTSVEGVEDMSTLTELHEAAIMHNLHLRYRQDKIYVRRDTESQETALQRHNKQMALPLL